jgi:hypothetical protein
MLFLNMVCLTVALGTYLIRAVFLGSIVYCAKGKTAKVDQLRYRAAARGPDQRCRAWDVKVAVSLFQV